MLIRPTYRGLERGLKILLIWLLTTNTALAFKPPQISSREYYSLPYFCKPHAYGWISETVNFSSPLQTEKEKALGWSVGVWHYCKGVVLAHRAELSRQTDNLDEAFKQINYSLSRIDKHEQWRAQMLITLARAYRVAGQWDRAIESLQQARLITPERPLIYSVWSSILFERKQYQEAIKILLEGDQDTGQQSAQIAYILGLAYFKAGDLENARIQQQKAASLGYPLDGLLRMITKADQGAVQ